MVFQVVIAEANNLLASPINLRSQGAYVMEQAVRELTEQMVPCIDEVVHYCTVSYMHVTYYYSILWIRRKCCVKSVAMNLQSIV